MGGIRCHDSYQVMTECLDVDEPSVSKFDAERVPVKTGL